MHLRRRASTPPFDVAPTTAVPDPRRRADEALRAARRRDASVVTLEVASSPADSCATVKIPRHVVTAADPHAADPDSTQVIRVPRGA